MPDNMFDLNKRFDLHPATEATGPKMDRMRATIKETAVQVVDNTPVSREQSLALTALEEALFWANAAIARNTVPLVDIDAVAARSAPDGSADYATGGESPPFQVQGGGAVNGPVPVQPETRPLRERVTPPGPPATPISPQDRPVG